MTENTGDVFMPSLVLFNSVRGRFSYCFGDGREKQMEKERDDSEGGEGRVVNGGEVTETLPVTS